MGSDLVVSCRVWKEREMQGYEEVGKARGKMDSFWSSLTRPWWKTSKPKISGYLNLNVYDEYIFIDVYMLHSWLLLVDYPTHLICTWVFKTKRTQQGNLLGCCQDTYLTRAM